MSSMHALGPSAPLPVAAGRHTYLTALRARLRAPILDRQLAAGIASWRTPVHAARALQLTSPRSRHTLAGSLERLVETADDHRGPFRGAAVQPCSEQVHEALPLILAIAVHLRSTAPVAASGVARLRALLSDGGGPCYLPSHDDALRSALEPIRQCLDAPD